MRRLALTSALPFLLALSCEAKVSLPIASFHPHQATVPSHLVGMQVKVRVLNPLRGADLSRYLAILDAIVKRNWYEAMPVSALNGKEGEVRIRFKVSSDGSIVTNTPEIEWRSGSKSLDNAAVDAVNSSTNLPPLPSSIKAKQLDLRLIFLYNRDHEY